MRVSIKNAKKNAAENNKVAKRFEKIGLILDKYTVTVCSYSIVTRLIIMGIYSWNNTTEHSLNNYAQSIPSIELASNSTQQGMVSELVYDEKHPIMDYILLPMLRQFGAQSRWLLWLSPNKKLSKHWLEQAGIPTNKVMQLSHMETITTIDAMEKALKSGNYSVVLGWLPELNEQDFVRLQYAAQEGHSIGFIMRPQKTYNMVSMQSGQSNHLKIHSNHYH